MRFTVLTFRLALGIAVIAALACSNVNLHAQGAPIELSKNWVFMNLDDLAAPPSAEKMLHMPEYGVDGLPKPKLSPVDQFSAGLERDQKSFGTAKIPADRGFASPERHGLANGLGSQNDATPSLVPYEDGRQHGLFQPDSPSGSFSSPSRFSDIFGGQVNKPSPQASVAQKARLEEFKQLLGLSSSAPPAADSFSSAGSAGFQGQPSASAVRIDPFKSPTGFGSSTAVPGSSTANAQYGLSSSWSQSGLDAQTGALSPPTVPGVNSPLNPSSLYPGYSSSSALPKAAPPDLTPPKPTFAAPLRKF
ncbi:MAG: hypothetical protein QOJ40_3056 [Verrucomicrobiota bacterium]